MDSQKVDMYIAANASFLKHSNTQINDMLLKADDSKYLQIQGANLKDPTNILIISIFWWSPGH